MLIRSRDRNSGFRATRGDERTLPARLSTKGPTTEVAGAV
jgi:hypothetical protein